MGCCYVLVHGCDLWKEGPSSFKEVLPDSRRARLGGRYGLIIIMLLLLPLVLRCRVQGHLFVHPHGCGHGGLSSRRHHLFGGRGWRCRACHLGPPFFELLAVLGKTDKREQDRSMQRMLTESNWGPAAVSPWPKFHHHPPTSLAVVEQLPVQHPASHCSMHGLEAS